MTDDKEDDHYRIILLRHLSFKFGLTRCFSNCSCWLALVFQLDILDQTGLRFRDASLSITGIWIKYSVRTRQLPAQLSPFINVPELRLFPGNYEVIRGAKKAFLIFSQ